MSHIKLNVAFATDSVWITDDGRPWLIQDKQQRRLVWRVHCGLPCLRIGIDWRSARWLSKRSLRTSTEGMQLEITLQINEEVIPGDNMIMNRLVLEQLQAHYFSRSIAYDKRINWEVFKPNTPIIQEKRKRAHIPTPLKNLRVMDFVFNESSRHAL